MVGEEHHIEACIAAVILLDDHNVPYFILS
jgi:hypothetical protein